LQGFGDPELRQIYLHARRRSRGDGPQTSDDYAVMAGLLLASLMQRQAATGGRTDGGIVCLNQWIRRSVARCSAIVDLP